MRAIINIMRIAATIMFIWLCNSKQEEEAIDTIKSYMDYTFIKTILFIFVLCA